MKKSYVVIAVLAAVVVLSGCPETPEEPNTPEVIERDPMPVETEDESVVDPGAIVFSVEPTVVQVNEIIMVTVKVNRPVYDLSALRLSIAIPDGVLVYKRYYTGPSGKVSFGYANGHVVVDAEFGTLTDPLEGEVLQIEARFLEEGDYTFQFDRENTTCYMCDGSEHIALDNVYVQDGIISAYAGVIPEEETPSEDEVEPPVVIEEEDCDDRGNTIFSISSGEVEVGKEVTITVSVNRPICYMSSFQMYLAIPDGVVVSNTRYLGPGLGSVNFADGFVIASTMFDGMTFEGDLVEFTATFEKAGTYSIWFYDDQMHKVTAFYDDDVLEVENVILEDGVITAF